MNTEMKLSIDTHLLNTAQAYYAKQGFIDTPTPWLVSETAYMVTCPPDIDHRRWHGPEDTFHVASAEQGFIEMLHAGQPIPERAQSTTPCFRWEEQFDELHLPFFYKTELYDANHDETALFTMISLAKALFLQLGVASAVQPMADGSYDLVCDQTGIELGSYGIRKFDRHIWTYGTGMALPRFEYVTKKRRSS